MSESSGMQQEKMVERSILRVMRAFVRFLIHQGVTYPRFADMLKQLYVQEVEQELLQKGERCTHSRISMMSGVHRKDVKRLLEERDEPVAVKEKISLNARLLSLWCGDPRFLTEDGKTRRLAKTTTEPDQLGFDELVRAVSQDIRPRTVLDEWLDRGIVQLAEDQTIELNRESLFLSDDLESKLHYFARNTADHISACDHNISYPEESYPERSLFFNKLSKESVLQLQQLSREKGQELLLAVNRAALACAEQDDLEGTGRERFTLGVYFYRETEALKNDQ